MNIWFVLIFIAAAFLLQSLLGFLQLQNFVKVFRGMSKNGKVLIGKNPKKLRAGSLLLLNIDQDANIQNANLMKGVTVFARFKPFKELENKSLPILASSYDEMKKFDPLTRECILNAYRNFVNYRTGKMSREDWDKSTNFLSLPVFNMWKNMAIVGFNKMSNKVRSLVKKA
ncbi:MULTISPECIES: transcriptional regulator GutM [Lactobacillus]|uniref:Transcriptional regulator n=1 Tax=Lactobacillus xujianguonis TaxID=2495899 RepID=A0A437SWT0_9LACO|nr:MULTISPECIES: transcriptional regulator GutM [Lactobacillus]RVU71385.1 transcriptional regulator [Lactobacillus xujianguonis]RVU76954.1 transcriptional regulator [Lactobacillus xujianguonis]